jgi:hypothetical protein
LHGDRLEFFPGQASVTLLKDNAKLLFAGDQACGSERFELLPSIDMIRAFALLVSLVDRLSWRPSAAV